MTVLIVPYSLETVRIRSTLSSEYVIVPYSLDKCVIVPYSLDKYVFVPYSLDSVERIWHNYTIRSTAACGTLHLLPHRRLCFRAWSRRGHLLSSHCLQIHLVYSYIVRPFPCSNWESKPKPKPKPLEGHLAHKKTPTPLGPP